jgi:hypothetical protein
MHLAPLPLWERARAATGEGAFRSPYESRAFARPSAERPTFGSRPKVSKRLVQGSSDEDASAPQSGNAFAAHAVRSVRPEVSKDERTSFQINAVLSLVLRPSDLLLALPKSKQKARHRAQCFDSIPANQNPLRFSSRRGCSDSTLLATHPATRAKPGLRHSWLRRSAARDALQRISLHPPRPCTASQARRSIAAPLRACPASPAMLGTAADGAGCP